MDGSMDKHGGYIWEFMVLWWIYLGTIAVPKKMGELESNGMNRAAGS